jgi:sulfate adenylyltransferase
MNQNTAHGGSLVSLLVSPERRAELTAEAVNLKSLDLTERQLCDLELLLNGGFSPLASFMGRADYDSVVQNMRLTSGELWPMPIVLDVSQEFADSLQKEEQIVLRDHEGLALAVLQVGESYTPDRQKEVLAVYGSDDTAHPGVEYVLNKTQSVYLSGKLEGLQLPVHYDFAELRHTPAELRDQFARRSWDTVVAFQTRNPMHRAHVELTKRAARDTKTNLLIQPVVGQTKPGDIDHFTRVRVYKSLLDRYPSNTTMVSLLPLAMRMGGPREALWHTIIRKNYGLTHFIVGRDHAGPGKNSQGEDFYGPYDAQELVEKHADELGMTIVPFKMVVYVPSQDKYMPVDEVPEGVEVASISGTEQRERLRDGRELPEWFTYPEVAAELHRTSPPRAQQGFTLFFTGFSGSGKSTIANAVMIKLLQLGGRSVTMLDGDVVRKHLSSELGFSKEHRNLNIQRIGYVASEISKHGGIAVCAPIAPYAQSRSEARELVEGQGGGFVLCYVSTPLEECERRDRKGLYKKARAGVIKEFTGISDPYEAPEDADITLDTMQYSADELAQQIILHLEQQGYL